MHVLVHAADLRAADMAYRGQRLHTWVEDECGCPLEIVQRSRCWGWYPIDVEPPPMPAFTVSPRRWVVERTLAWVGRDRRLSNDYEYLFESSETMINLAMSRPVQRRLTRQAPYGVPRPQRQKLTGLTRAFYTASRAALVGVCAPLAPSKSMRHP